MKIKSSDNSPAAEISRLLSLITDSDKNLIAGIFLDETLVEFFYLNKDISVPSIPVGELDYYTGIDISRNLISVIPEYLYEHALLEKRKPAAEQHSLQFIKMIPGRLIDFVHILRFDFKITGGHGALSGKGDNQTFPPYNTDRIRFKSRLVPIVKGSEPFQIDSLKLKSELRVDKNEIRINPTSVFFDEFSSTEISIDFSAKSGNEIFPISAKLYQFISYDYFTACMNIPDPSVSKLNRAVEIFEPLFFFLYFQYREGLHEIEKNQLSIWGEYLNLNEYSVTQSPLLKESLRDFFSLYTLYRDDELMLKGLRKFIVSDNAK